jgi:hypothetical protein
MYTTDTSLHGLWNEVQSDRRRHRARARWIGFVALIASAGALALAGVL